MEHPASLARLSLKILVSLRFGAHVHDDADDEAAVAKHRATHCKVLVSRIHELTMLKGYFPSELVDSRTIILTQDGASQKL